VQAKLGDRVTEQVTGMTGILNAITTWYSGQVRVGILPEKKLGKDGLAPQDQMFDNTHIKVIKAGVHKPVAVPQEALDHARLGDMVSDLITGFEGIITSETVWLNGCRRLGVRPSKFDRDGKPLPAEYFDWCEVKLIKRNALPVVPATVEPTKPLRQKPPGGPAIEGDMRKFRGF